MKSKIRKKLNAEKRERLKLLRAEYAQSLQDQGASLSEIAYIINIHKTTVSRLLHEARERMESADRDCQRDEPAGALDEKIQTLQEAKETDCSIIYHGCTKSDIARTHPHIAKLLASDGLGQSQCSSEGSEGLPCGSAFARFLAWTRGF